MMALSLFLHQCAMNRGVVKNPFDDYKSDAFFFRAVGIGEDMDMQRARSKAVHQAKVEIARSANSVCQQIVLDYLNQTGNGTDITLKEQFITISTESVSESLVNVIVEDVVFKKDKNNKYTCYAKVKVQESNVFATFSNRSSDKMEINAELFKQITDKVINQINTKLP